MEMVRANRVSVQVEKDGFVAVFHRTHRMVAEVHSKDTAFTPDMRMNRTTQREMFRIYAMDNSQSWGIIYDPEDRRTEDNLMPRKYEDDATAMEWASKLVHGDIQTWADKMAADMKLVGMIALKGIEADEITERGGWNGRMVNSKYGNGAWAYADVMVTATITYTSKDGVTTEGYIPMVVNIVSGQLKKPSSIGDMGYTYTGFKSAALVDLQAEIDKDFPPAPKPAKDAPKDEQLNTTDNPAPEQQESASEQPTEQKSNGKKSGKGKSKGKKADK